MRCSAPTSSVQPLKALLIRADRGQPVLPGGERPRAGRDRRAGRRAGRVPADSARSTRSGCRRRSRRCWPPASTAAAGGEAAAPDGRRDRQGRAVHAAPGHRGARRMRSFRRRCRGSRRPSCSIRLSLFPELEYTFKHALTHDVAYGSLLQERRGSCTARSWRRSSGCTPTAWTSTSSGWPTMPCAASVWDVAAARTASQAGLRAADRSANREAVRLARARAGGRRASPEQSRDDGPRTPAPSRILVVARFDWLVHAAIPNAGGSGAARDCPGRPTPAGRRPGDAGLQPPEHGAVRRSARGRPAGPEARRSIR